MLDTEKKYMNLKFENFIQTLEGEDLLNKTQRLSEVLSSDILTGNEALGMLSLNQVKPISKIKEKDGRIHSVIMLGSNSYLNLSDDKKVIQASLKALKKYGYGMGAVSNYAGITDLHRELELKIARLYQTEDAIVFPSGYGTNVGVISSICGVNDVIINDAANHASIFDGCKLSGAEIKVYPHRDMKFLERILSRIPDNKKGRLIITDGVFSMDGDIAPLDKIVELAKKYNARVMVDDAHGLGVVGKTGRGTCEYFGLEKEVDLKVGMLSKAPGGLGGYCAATGDIIQYLRLYARSYFFSTALPAPIVGGLNAVFDMFEKDKAGREKLWKKIEYTKLKLMDYGFDIGHSQSAIIPVMIYDEEKLFKIYDKLRREGVYVNIVTYPAVRRKECRLRLCVMKNLSYSQIDRAVYIIAKICKEYEII